MGISREGTGQTEDGGKNWAYPAFGLLLIYALVRSLFAAAGRPFWYDELLTQTVAGLGSWQRIMEALRLPADGQPPLFYVIEHFASKICANQQIALRLPAAAGLMVTLICVFVYAKRSRGGAIALLCSAALMLTCVFQSYAEEARPYSMVLALIAFAMVCYQRSGAAVWVALFGVSLALAGALHYLAVLAMVPFGVAELFESWRIGKMRWGGSGTFCN
jgi:4-amino-4-deoxy-L-arabinose transferase-like glycosyltransferase